VPGHQVEKIDMSSYPRAIHSIFCDWFVEEKTLRKIQSPAIAGLFCYSTDWLVTALSGFYPICRQSCLAGQQTRQLPMPAADLKAAARRDSDILISWQLCLDKKIPSGCTPQGKLPPWHFS